MAMSVGQAGGEETPMSDINTTPLVDVMLVLLIIFLITIPVANKSIKVKMANIAYQPTISKAENIVLTIKGEGAGCGVYLGPTKYHIAELQEKAVAKLMAERDRLSPKDLLNPDKYPEVHIRADKDTPYHCVGGVVFTMQRVGFPRVGFISEPKVATTS
jgi:biopolymer transport protein ExbD